MTRNNQNRNFFTNELWSLFKRRASELRQLLHRVLVRHRRRLRRSVPPHSGDVVEGPRGWQFSFWKLRRQQQWNVRPSEDSEEADGPQGRPDPGNGGGDQNAERGSEGQRERTADFRRRRSVELEDVSDEIIEGVEVAIVNPNYLLYTLV